MLEIYHLQKRHPDAGGFRIWSLRGKPDLCGTYHRAHHGHQPPGLYGYPRHVRTKRASKAAPQPHPFKATSAHEYWFIDGRIMDFALDGVTSGGV